MIKPILPIICLLLCNSCFQKKVNVRDIHSNFGADIYKLNQMAKRTDNNKELKEFKSEYTIGDTLFSNFKYRSTHQLAKIKQVVNCPTFYEIFEAYYPDGNLPAHVHHIIKKYNYESKKNSCYKESRNYYINKSNADYYVKKHGSHLITSFYRQKMFSSEGKVNFKGVPFVTNPNDAISIMNKDTERVKHILKNWNGKPNSTTQTN